MRKFFILILLVVLSTVSIHTALADYKTESNKVETRVGNPKATTPGNAPPPPSDLRQGIIDEFGITFNGLSQEKLQYAWEKFWDIKHTKFFDLLGNVTIDIHDDTSEQVNCNLIRLRRGLVEDGGEVLFKAVITHELSHIIYHCNDESLSHTVDHENAFAAEGGVTYYGEVACYGTAPITEDYAEMLAYYLNPGVVEQTGCGSRGVVPYADGKFPKHYATAKMILGDY